MSITMLLRPACRLRRFAPAIALSFAALIVATVLLAAPAAAASPAPAQKATVGEVAPRLAPALPWLLGMDAPRTYLVLIQNSHELRATGGFIAALARITLDKGRITDLEFGDSYQIYQQTSTYPPAPKPMQEYMNIAIMLMRDANWSPDLPTTAQVARALYAQDTGKQVDGVFTVNLAAVKHLMTAFGPLQVEGSAEPVTSDNIEQEVIKFWERPTGTDKTVAEGWSAEWFGQRKDFIPMIAKAAIDKVMTGDIDFGALLIGAQAAMNDRSIQGWVANPDVQAVLSEARWDGGLHPQQGADYLAIVDTNMGYNKVDAAMQRAADYRVSWPDGPDQPALATLTLTYTHPIQAEDPGCDQSPRYGKTYADMIARCYFDYVRVYAPAGSELITFNGVKGETITSERGERGTQTMAGFFVMPPNSRQQLELTYRLPAGITPDNYRLLVQRQAGANALPFTLQINGAPAQQYTIVEGYLEYPQSDQPNG